MKFIGIEVEVPEIWKDCSKPEKAIYSWIMISADIYKHPIPFFRRADAERVPAHTVHKLGVTTLTFSCLHVAQTLPSRVFMTA